MSSEFRDSINNKLFPIVEDTRVFNVKLVCKSSTSGEDDIVQEFSVRSKTAEEAKNSALSLAKEAGYFDCRVDDLSMVVDPLDPSSANLGIGRSLGADPSADDGNKGPSLV